MIDIDAGVHPESRELTEAAARALLEPLVSTDHGIAELKRVLRESGDGAAISKMNPPAEKARLLPPVREQLLRICLAPTSLAAIARSRLEHAPVDPLSDVEDVDGYLTAAAARCVESAAWATIALDAAETEPGIRALEAYLESRHAPQPEPEVPAPPAAAPDDAAGLALVLDRLAELQGTVIALSARLEPPKKPADNGVAGQLGTLTARLDGLAGQLKTLDAAVDALGERVRATADKTERTGQRVQQVNRWTAEFEGRVAEASDVRLLGDAISELGSISLDIGRRVESLELRIDTLAARETAVAPEVAIPEPTDTPATPSTTAAEPEPALTAEEIEAEALRLAEEREADERARQWRHDEAVNSLGSLIRELIHDNPDYAYIDGHNIIVEPMKGGFMDGDESSARRWLYERVAEMMDIIGLERVWLAFDTKYGDMHGHSDYPGLSVRFLSNQGVGDGADEYIGEAVSSRSPEDLGVVFTSDRSHIWPAIARAREDGYNVSAVDGTLLFATLTVLDHALSTSDLERAQALESLRYELIDATPQELRDVDLVGLLGFKDPAIKALNQYRTARRRTDPHRVSTLHDEPRMRSAAHHLAGGRIEAAIEDLDKAEFAESTPWDVRPLRAAANLAEGSWREAKRIAESVCEDSQALPARLFEARCIAAIADSMSSGVALDTGRAAEWFAELGVPTYRFGSSVLRVLEKGLEATGAGTAVTVKSIEAIRGAMAHETVQQMSDVQMAELRAAGYAMSAGNYPEARACYQRLHDGGIAPRHRLLNETMLAIAERKYADAQGLIAEYALLVTTPNLEVQRAALAYLAAVGCGDEADEPGLRRAYRAAYGYEWSKSPVRYLVKGLSVTEDGEMREAAETVEDVLRGDRT